MNLKRGTFAVGLALLWSIKSYSLELGSQCYYSKNTQQITGENVSDKIEIASLSKIFTTFWALQRLGSGYQFKTEVSYKMINATKVDLHFKGSFDPNFTRDHLQYLILLLNQKGITEINNLTFDENFIFIDNLDLIFASDSIPHNSKSTRIKDHLTKALAQINARYSLLLPKLKFYQPKSDWPDQINIKVDQIRQITSAQYEKNNDEFSHKINLMSTSLKNILFEMNQFSNNHVADFLFQFLGGAAEFKKFALMQLQFGSDHIDVINGSGLSTVIGQNKKYNKASCYSLIKTLYALSALGKIQSLNLQDIFPTVGQQFSAEKPNTVSKYYTTDFTDQKLIGKTGTVNPAVGLAGQFISDEDMYLFTIIYKTNDSDEWMAARQQILAKLTEKYQAIQFLNIKNKIKPYISFDIRPEYL